jgi:hypothetical protein
MNQRGKKLEPKLGLNMPFSELVARLAQTDPREVDESIERAKQQAQNTQEFSLVRPKRKKRTRNLD